MAREGHAEPGTYSGKYLPSPSSVRPLLLTLFDPGNAK